MKRKKPSTAALEQLGNCRAGGNWGAAIDENTWRAAANVSVDGAFMFCFLMPVRKMRHPLPELNGHTVVLLYRQSSMIAEARLCRSAGGPGFSVPASRLFLIAEEMELFCVQAGYEARLPAVLPAQSRPRKRLVGCSPEPQHG